MRLNDTMGDTTPAPLRTRRTRRPLHKSARLWVPLSIVLLLVALAAGAVLAVTKLMPRVDSAKAALEQTIPLADQVQQQIVSGDATAAASTAAQMKALTADARAQTSGRLWQGLEWVPVAGANLRAVREASATLDDFVAGAVIPASTISVDALAPQNGRIDTAVLSSLSATFGGIADAVSSAQTSLDAIDRNGLIGQVSDGLDRFDAAIAKVAPAMEPARKALAVLPDLLGANGARNYLVLVQNNAESRGTGGNPAALVMLTANDGALSISQQASSSSFPYGRPIPVTDLDPQAVALYGDKIGRFVQDVTTTADFPESARVMRAFWAESFGTPVDAVVSIDPIALSYLLFATGPVTLADGTVLTHENAVEELLNRVYSRYDSGDTQADNADQDAYFAMAAGAIFTALTSSHDLAALYQQFTRAVSEGRVLYAPSDEAQRELLAGTRVLGELPQDNTASTMLGVYVNDITEGKLDYYVDTAIDVASDVCTVAPAQAPTFTTAMTLTYLLQPDDVAGVPHYVSPGRFFPKGDLSTDVVLYGPVGATFAAASVDGQSVTAQPVEHLGRPAVKINVLNHPATAHTVTATFTGAAGAAYGPLEVWHTPMVRDTPITLNVEGCRTED